MTKRCKYKQIPAKRKEPPNPNILIWCSFKIMTLRDNDRNEKTYLLPLGESKEGKFRHGTRNNIDSLTVLSQLS